MKIVWERESSTVRDVYETLLERRKVAYTTVMTMMKILEQKKYLKRTQADPEGTPPAPQARHATCRSPEIGSDTRSA